MPPPQEPDFNDDMLDMLLPCLRDTIASVGVVKKHQDAKRVREKKDKSQMITGASQFLDGVRIAVEAFVCIPEEGFAATTGDSK